MSHLTVGNQVFHNGIPVPPSWLRGVSPRQRFPGRRRAN
ncbi:hypothetical protein SBA4_1900018 [Candidatus Sulfopaludibacter sp. SbA4]|nr:hypothetical protein SBA4_1900018 [Candidatus Sulfopaludibacter sp. SbA4]